MKHKSDRGSAETETIAIGGIILFVVALIVFLVWITNTLGKTDGGHVGIVRNGGWFDNNKIRQVLPPNSGLTNIGFASSIHNYPTSQRYFTIAANGSGDSDEVVQVPTADGVEVGIEGQMLFTLNTDPANDYAILKQFDNLYGTRTFRCTGSNDRKHVYDGDEGFSCFLDQIVGPIIANDLRVAVGDLRCADLVASCSLVQNNASQIDQSKIGVGNVNLTKIETDITSSLQSDMNATLRGNYVQVNGFNLIKVDLPQQVQQAITSAQSQFAQVSRAQAQQKTALINAQTRIKVAREDALANKIRQKGYNNCSTCAQIDIVKSLPQGITVYAPGNSNVAIPTK